MKSLLFVNRFYWPETPATGQLLSDLAEGLAARGWSVTVITSAADAGIPRREIRNGVSIRRVRSSRWGRHGVLGKATDYGTFYLGAVLAVLRQAARGSIVVAMTDPPMLGSGVWLAARLRRAHVVQWIQDIYPEVAIALAGHRWLRCLLPLRNAAWRRAAVCVTLGSDMEQSLVCAGVDLARRKIIPNWGPTGVVPQLRGAAAALRTTWGVTGKFVVAYSGNLGRVHDLESVVALARALREDRGIAFVFIGDGARRASLEAQARQLGLANVQFLPPQPRERLSDSLAAADLHVVTLRAGCERFVFPSKLYGIAAAGRPVLFIGPTESEIALQIREAEMGVAAARDEGSTLVAAIRRLAADPEEWGRHAGASRNFAARHSTERAIARWERLLEGIQPFGNS